MSHKINPEVKAKLVEALRSGKYAQGQGALRQVLPDGTEGFCCLGVLCDILDPEGWSGAPKKDASGLWERGNRYSHRTSTWSYPSESIREKAGFKDPGEDFSTIPSVVIDGDCASLDYFNDMGKTFEEIAKAIEEQL